MLDLFAIIKHKRFIFFIISFLMFNNKIISKNYDILFVDNYMKANSALEEYLRKVGVSYLKVDKYNSYSEIEGNEFKGVILSGGPLLYSSNNINLDDVVLNFSVLLNMNVPILGICFGHQSISKVFGSKIERLPIEINKFESIEILDNEDIFKNIPENVSMFEYHNDCVSSLPNDFKLIATSKSCKIEAFKHVSKSIYGLQFHPERSGVDGYKILDNFLDICAIKKRP